jgi:hypothetical protein
VKLIIYPISNIYHRADQVKTKVAQYFIMARRSFFFLFKNRTFFLKMCKNRKLFCPGTSRDRGVCPGTFTPALVPGQRDTGTRKMSLSRDKGTAGRPVPVCPGTSRGTSRPVKTLHQTSWHCPLINCLGTKYKRTSVTQHYSYFKIYSQAFLYLFWLEYNDTLPRK